VLVVTGMSGAGRSSAAKVLEDLGFSVIDNLPPQLIAQAISHHEVAERRRQLAVVIDSRVGDTLEPLTAAIDELERQGVQTKVLFLEAEDSHLVRRYEENRRPHPVRRESLAESITAERKLLSDVKGAADVVIDTTELNIHQLRQRIGELFSGGDEARPMRVTLTSFGYKHGLPRDADLIFDVRFLPNPHWVKELRQLRGTDPQVREYVLSFPDAKEFLAKAKDLLSFLIPKYEEEGKSYLAIGIGCTGGHHRSVALAEELVRWLDQQGITASVSHRDTDL
jgi:RNase adapter protein RapZ